MIVLGIVLLVLGLVTAFKILFWIGVILLIVGACLYGSGRYGHPVGGHRHYY